MKIIKIIGARPNFVKMAPIMTAYSTIKSNVVELDKAHFLAKLQNLDKQLLRFLKMQLAKIANSSNVRISSPTITLKLIHSWQTCIILREL